MRRAPAGCRLARGVLAWAVAVPVPALAQGDPASPWYLERGTAPRPAAAPDEVPTIAAELAALMKDGGVPGFYDGQFRSVAGRFDELAAVACDPDMSHVLRVMAVMALQEAGDGERLAAVLQPLLLPADEEFQREQEDLTDLGRTVQPGKVRQRLEADLSLHARFALAKDGQPAAVLEKIDIMRQSQNLKRMARLLDPTVRSERSQTAWIGRDTMFRIGYHYQQFDDYAHASDWYHLLCDNLPGHSDTTWAHYNLGCIAALTGRPEEAIDQLRQAYGVGFTDSSWMAEDGDLRSLRERPDFRALLAEMRNEAPGRATGPPSPNPPGNPLKPR